MLTPTLRRSGPTVVMVAVLAGAAVAALGAPDLPLIREFMAGNYPTVAAAVAVAGLVTWLVIGFAMAVVVTNSFRGVASQAQFVQRRWTRAIFFAVAGTVVLGAGLIHHTSSGYSICCGSLEEAQRTLGQ